MRRALILLLFATNAFAADPAALLRKVDEYRNPFDSFSIDVKLTSYTKSGSEVSRYHVSGKGSDRSLVEFTYPQSERGKSLLMLRDAMWIYMPDTSRPIRISPLQRLAGQASNGDVARTSFTIDYNPQSVAEDGEAYVIDLVAKDPAVAYNRVKLWVDKTTYQPLRADFYVVSGKLIKRAWYREYGEMAGHRVVKMVEIEDLLRPGNRTVMRYAALQAKDNPDRMFVKESMGR
jgi:outer membrane lipoprotein-sorting protein